MPRTPPDATPEQRRTAARLAALRAGTPAAVRAWAERHGVPIINAEDDELLLLSIHEARAAEPALPAHVRAASRRWLRANHDRILKERGVAAAA